MQNAASPSEPNPLYRSSQEPHDTPASAPAGSADGAPVLNLERLGAAACFLLPAVHIIAGLIYLAGNLREALGPATYDLADFLFGPLGAAGLVAAALAVKEQLGGGAPRRMSVALLAAVLAAAVFAAIAFMRSANRHYHLDHPELNLENNPAVLTVWTTLISGLFGTGWHLLGWALVLTGSAALSTGRLPAGLGGMYLLTGTIAFFVYVLPEGESLVMLPMLILGVWQGIFLWNAGAADRSGS